MLGTELKGGTGECCIKKKKKKNVHCLGLTWLKAPQYYAKLEYSDMLLILHTDK